jgi:exodeoxyribonuclease-3
MRIATWNINGVKARLETAVDWLAAVRPDIVLFQETKSDDAGFPRASFEDLGYNLALFGQKGFNGVAILSRMPLEDVTRGLPGDPSDEQARFIEAVLSVPSGAIRIASVYLPNGNPPHSDKFTYKLAWMERLGAWATDHLRNEEAFILGGDFNIIPEPNDARFPENWTTDALFQPESRTEWRRIRNLGLTDALRSITDRSDLFTYWDYQAGAWQKNNGIRIDHFLMSPQAADRLNGLSIDKQLRAADKPSDHVPVILDINVY